MLFKTKLIDQNKLSSECWRVQMQGRSACADCEFEGTDECGGENIIKTGKNEKGHKVPIGG